MKDGSSELQDLGSARDAFASVKHDKSGAWVSFWLLATCGLGLAILSVKVPDYFGPTEEECAAFGERECRYMWGDR